MKTSRLIIKTGLLLCIIIISLSYQSKGQHTDNSEVSPAIRKQWIAGTSKVLKKFKPENCPGIIEADTTEFDGYFRISYRLTEPACIKFENGDWIYLISNSSHNNAKVGDITLAIDNRKRQFINEGHVCAGIIHFIVEEKIEVKSADQFFKNFTSDTDAIHWKIKD